jgi:GNAT superfamily N-acetyltransferase
MLDFCVRRTAAHPAPSALIDEVVVDERMRGRGVGRKLIEAAVSEARRMGCCEIEVSTERSNGAARRFYAECGFDEESVLLEKDL